MISISNLIKRAKSLNYEFDPDRTVIKRHKGIYDMDVIKVYLEGNIRTVQSDILHEIEACNIESAITRLDHHLDRAHKVAKIRRNRVEYMSHDCMERANLEFNNYLKCLDGQSNETLETAFSRYQIARNAVTADMLRRDHERWRNTMNDSDTKIWQTIDWKGNMVREKKEQPEIEDLALHFEKLYSLNNIDTDEHHKEIDELETNVYVPQLDNPISKEELDNAVNGIKKGGYDYNVNVIKVLCRLMYPILLLFFNIMFFIEYPKSLARSLLTAIPKKGDLSLPINYRGVQMLAALGALYDHIIANRLRK